MRAEVKSGFFGGQTEIELSSAKDAFIPPGSRQVALEVKLARNVLDTAMLNFKAATLFVEERQKYGGKLHVFVA